MAPPTKLTSPEYYLNRELGLLAFNQRVLAQAEDQRNPLLERLKFLCIVSSNLDEFFEVRVAGLKEQIEFKTALAGVDGMTPTQTYTQVCHIAHELVERQYRIFNEVLTPELAAEGIHFIRRTHWNEEQAAWIREYFFRELMPVLTPIGLDPAHPFPRVLNKSLNFAVELEGKDAFGRNSGMAIVQAPRALPRVIRLPSEIAGCEYGFVFLSSILHAHVDELFSGMTARGCYQFRVTRNSDLIVDEEEIKDLRLALQGELTQRQFGDEVRLEVADNCSQEMAAFLLGQFGLNPEDLYRVNGPVNLVRLMQIPDWVDRPDLKYTRYMPSIPREVTKEPDIFKAIRKGDILLHLPFQSFNPVVEFIKQAAADPDVLAIKQTVYRTSSDSTLMTALIDAARSGKEVTVVVELMARFDEEANINWAAKLEKVGAHVVYGVVGHKTHAKMAMVVRREDGKLHRYVHLSTGNYHQRTARFYTDFGLLTCHAEICEDVNDIFAQLTGLGKATKLRHLWQSPFTLHQKLIKAIHNEAEQAKAGHKARIIAKMNALLDPDIIKALYEASVAGVQIDLIVRGVCALKPGIPGVSENIRVRSIVGRFLEHSRIYYFLNGGAQDVYLASADWMYRNFFRRIETCFPVLDQKLKKRVLKEGLEPYLKDNLQAWEMQADGCYRHKKPGRAQPYSAQEHLLANFGQELAREE
ncbi:polyphosphate kinase [Novimethylophilus kurashikiensis]|uniref:Polyphosphate kinase n=1 Tax=Novimethylophilus kurashikiensis TaxID=1825523 RepID=A0A2R5F837_9PROT|nr:polyphosphate kinase 1 [Novimethylophilus kurashikiensis]GBG13718.1 polyphosphate kinase [Novimethylophilus kurashikiensis]